MSIKLLANTAKRDANIFQVTLTDDSATTDTTGVNAVTGGDRASRYKTSDTGDRRFVYINNDSNFDATHCVITRADRFNSHGVYVHSKGSSQGPTLDTSALGSTPTVWLKADSGITTDASGNVSQWVCSGSLASTWTQSDSARRATFVASAINGHPALRFDDSINTNMISSTTVGDMFNADAMTVFIVVKPSDVSNNDYFFTSDGIYFAFSTYGSKFRFLLYDGSNDIVESGTLTDGEVVVCEARHESGTIYMKVNNETESSTASGNTQGLSRTGKLSLGSVYGGSGDIAEILCFDAALSSTDRKTIYRYLAAKYRDDPWYHGYYPSFSETLIGADSTDFVESFGQTVSASRVGVDITGSFTKRVAGITFADAVEFSSLAPDVAVSYEPVSVHDAALDFHGRRYYLDAYIEIGFINVSGSVLNTYEKLPRTEPVFFYDSDGYAIPCKLWHCLILKDEIAEIADDIYSIRFNLGLLRHW